MQAPEKHLENNNVYLDLISITSEVEEKIKSGDLTYDDYMEIQIKYFKGKDNDFIRSLVRRHIDRKNDANDPSTWTKTNQLFEQVKGIDINYTCLLTDPLILFRKDRFLEFIKNRPLQSPIEIRRQFINTFPTETYYRGVVMRDGSAEYPNGHLAPKTRKIIHETKSLNSYREYAERSIKSAINDSTNDRSYMYLIDTPLLTRLEERMLSHVTSRATDSEVISVTKIPEIAWYVTSDNNKKLWKQWGSKTFLRMFRFQMNSFYAPSVIDAFFLNEEDFKGKVKNISFSDRIGSFSTPTNNPGIEQLVPIALPKDFDKNYLDYRPEWDEISFKPKSFTFPRETDWK